MHEKTIKVDRFSFSVSVDPSAEALSAIEVMVSFMDEPCCDDNGHQYRFYLPVGLQESSLQDLCKAFAAAVHCDQHAMAA